MVSRFARYLTILTGKNITTIYAILDGYDPTPYDADTPAKGPHTWHEFGESPEIAATNLIQRLYENI